MTRSHGIAPLITALVVSMTCRVALFAQTPREPIAPTEDLKTLTLVKTGDGKAVVRFGKSPLRLISAGDRLGLHRAEVLEIAAGRVVLEESFTGADGQPNRAQIIVKDGETGGKRFLMRPEEPRPAAIRPETVAPRVRQ